MIFKEQNTKDNTLNKIINKREEIKNDRFIILTQSLINMNLKITNPRREQKCIIIHEPKFNNYER